MKSLKQIVVASLALGAASAYADYAVTGGASSVGAGSPAATVGVGTTIGNAYVYSPTAPTTAPVSGYSEYAVDVTTVASVIGSLESSTMDVNAYGTAGLDITSIALVGTPSELGGSFVSLSSTHYLDTAVVGAGTFDILVGWTLPTGSAGLYTLNMGVDINNSDVNGGGPIPELNGGSANAPTYLTSVPEPGQVVAGCMLLGFGGLVFVGRRMVKRA